MRYGYGSSIGRLSVGDRTVEASPLKIDLHTHILPKTWPDLRERYGYGGFMHLDHRKPGCARMVVDGGETFREVEENCWSPERRIEECDRDGVQMQILSTVPVMFSYWAEPKDTLDLSQLLNDHIANIVARYPKRFAGLCTLPMQNTRLAIGELDRCVNELGMVGTQIATHVNGKNLDDPEVFPILECAADLGTAVFVHPWDMMARDRMTKYWLSWLVGMPAETALAISSVIFGGVLDRLPNLRICFAHGGGAFPGTVGRIEHGYHARKDLCAVAGASNPRSYLGKFYLDSLVHTPSALHNLIDLVGTSRIALGTDYPFPLGEAKPGALIDSMTDLTPEDRQQMLANTGLELLGLGREAFV